MGMVGSFIVELKDMVKAEEMSDTAKSYFLDRIAKFQHAWEDRVSYQGQIEHLQREINENEERNQRHIERLEQTANELRYEKDEVIKHYEAQLDLKSKAIDRIVVDNQSMELRTRLAEELVFSQAQFLTEFRNRTREDY